MSKACSTHRVERETIRRISVGKPEGRSPLRRYRRRWMDNITMDIREITMGWYGLDSSGSG
jgi:hypothetical protein